jgi:hypothetical protein
MPNDPEILKRMQGQAVDLGKALDERKAEQIEKEAAAQRAAEEYATRWAKAMKRTFKGIFPAPSRKAFMRAHLAKMEREQEAS